MSENQKQNKFNIGNPLFSAGGIVLILVILVMVNLIFSKVNLRWDTTKDKVYSLSEGTRTILSKLENDVIIKLFFTKDNVNTPVQIKTFAERVKDFLKEYEYFSDGKVRVEIYNPRPDSEEEDWALKYGVKGVNLPTGEKLYFGLVALCADQEETIPSLDPSREEHLEYDITRMITRVQSPKKFKIGIISGLPVFGQPAMPFNMQNNSQNQEEWLFVSELKKSYDVEQIPTTADTIDDDIDLLMLIHPKHLEDSLLYAVDQYVMKGGNLIVFADPMAYSDNDMTQQDKSSSPEKLFKSWGIKMDRTRLVTDYNLATKVRTPNSQVEDHPMWLTIRKDSLNDSEIITSKLESLLMPMAGAIEKLPASTFEEYTPLIQSTTNSMLNESFKLRFGGEALRRDFKATVDKYDLAVKFRGKFKSAFPEGKPKSEDASETGKEQDASKSDAPPHISESQKTATIIVVSDVDMLNDSFYVARQNFLGFKLARIFNDNLNFLLNATEMLTGSDELIGLRSRGKFERPFTKVQELQRVAQSKWMAREQELVKKVEETNRKLRELEQKKDPSQQYIISEEQEKEIARFKEERQRIRQELKEVRRNLRADIEALGMKLKFINIGLMPLLVSIVGIGYALYRRKRSLNR